MITFLVISVKAIIKAVRNKSCEVLGNHERLIQSHSVSATAEEIIARWGGTQERTKKPIDQLSVTRCIVIFKVVPKSHLKFE